MSIESKSIPIRRHDELEDIRPDAHHEAVTHADVSGAVHAHNDLVNPHPLAKNIGGRGFGLGDGNLAVLPTATEGQVLMRGATAWEAGDLAGTLPPAGGDFILVSEANITSPVTSVLFDGLDLVTDKNYFLILIIQHEIAAGICYRLYINEDTVNTNYRSQRTLFTGSTVATSSNNFPRIADDGGVERTAFTFGYMALANQSFYYLGRYGAYSPSHDFSIALRHIHPQTNVNSIRITASHTNGIGVGSRLRLFRL